MANRFSQTFSLTDIFNNKNLAGKLPLINYKEKELDGGNVQVRTSPKSIARLVYETSVKTARPFYKPFLPSKSGNIINLNGNLLQDDDYVVDSVYNALLGIKSILIWTCSNVDMIRSAIKESEKNKRLYGNNSKLYLRANSMQSIENMSKKQIEALLSDIMENIFYGDDFPETQKKFHVKQLQVNSALPYEQRKLQWKRKIGD